MVAVEQVTFGARLLFHFQIAGRHANDIPRLRRHGCCVCVMLLLMVVGSMLICRGVFLCTSRSEILLGLGPQTPWVLEVRR